MTIEFSTLPLTPAMLANLASMDYRYMTPVQAESLPHILKNKDLIAQAKTGSGKTAAFGIGLLAKLDPNANEIQALVLCPTRELADQVAKELRKLARFISNIKILTLCGGTPLGPQLESLSHGADIVVGTPGRIQDHLQKASLQLDRIKTLVLDEADRMLDMGFNDAISAIIATTPRTRQTLLFSATYPAGIDKLSGSFQKQPARVSVESLHSSTQIEQWFYEIEDTKRLHTLSALLGHYQLESSVIFCNTKIQCQDVADHLQDKGIDALALHGDLEQKDRDLVLVRFANKSCSVLVATDVAARGLDIKDLQAVINFELSPDPEVHVHRIGRTGRAGKQGIALSLYSPAEAHRVIAIEAYQKNPAHTQQPTSLNTAAAYSQQAPMVTLCIDGGRKQKVRPGDILGAITGDAGIPGQHVGKIDIFDFHAYVAIERSIADKALQRLSQGKIKGRNFKIRKVR
ncbi:ATP-dependent RNA helicase DbpA [Candidatus Methylospira mobilis]|uniref:ATP-dependent RNA helicase DbpA n=1 Tax=Candidatus Methylospira mobilis TaxID=1808979 RepID=UPI00387EA8FA